MSVFPGDMSIGWGFGLERQEEDMSLLHTPIAPPFKEEIQPDEPHLTDPLLAVSELEQRVNTLEGMLKTYFAEAPSKRIYRLERQMLVEQTRDIEHLSRITDLEERLRSLTIVVNSLVGTEELHEGQCEKCDRVAQLNSGNICEGCFLDELEEKE